MQDPFKGSGVYALDDRHRLVIPRGIESYLPWFSQGKTLACLGMPGHAGGLAVFSPTALQHLQRILRATEGRDLGPEDMATPIFRLARFLSVTWEVSIGTDRRMTLPEGARDLGIVPAEPNDRVGVVAFRGVLEIWGVSELRAHAQTAGEVWAELTKRVPLPAE